MPVNLICPIDDEKMASLLETPIEETVANVCTNILIHIKLLERFYEEALRSKVAGDLIEP